MRVAVAPVVAIAVAGTGAATDMMAAAGIMTVAERIMAAVAAAIIMGRMTVAVRTGTEIPETGAGAMTVTAGRSIFLCLCLVVHVMARDMRTEAGCVMPTWHHLPGRIIRCFHAGKAVIARTDPGLQMEAGSLACRAYLPVSHPPAASCRGIMLVTNQQATWHPFCSATE